MLYYLLLAHSNAPNIGMDLILVKTLITAEVVRIDLTVFDTNIKEGDRVKVTDGALQGFVGEVEAVDKTNAKCRVNVSMFGRPTPVDLEYRNNARDYKSFLTSRLFVGAQYGRRGQGLRRAQYETRKEIYGVYERSRFDRRLRHRRGRKQCA